VAVTFDAVSDGARTQGRRKVSPGVKGLALFCLWVTIALSGVVYIEPAPYDALMLGLIFLLPVAGLVVFTRGLALYLMLVVGIAAAGYLGVTQAGILDAPALYVTITLYLLLSSVVIAACVAQDPEPRVHLIMSAYVVAALGASVAALIGYFNLVPGVYDIFTEFGRARGTFQDPNLLGAFLVPPLIYASNMALRARTGRAILWAAVISVLLLATLLSVSRGAWLNLTVSLLVFGGFMVVIATTNRERLRLMFGMAFAGVCAVGLLAAAYSIPKVGELVGHRLTFQQSYDVGPEGRFGGQLKGAELMATHPLGIGAEEFGRVHHHEDVHQVYINMYLNTGWIGGTLYLFLVLSTIALGVKLVMRDRGGSGLSAVLVAAFIGIAIEGAVIDTNHWRHFYLIMAMIWGMAVVAPSPEAHRAEER